MPSATPPTAKKAPVRMKNVFSQMMAECPQDIHVYGACVAEIRGKVDRGACDREFAKLRACFQKALRTPK